MGLAVHRFRGRIKEIAGKAVGSERLEAEGRTDQAKAGIRRAAMNARERARGVRDSLRRGRF
ncbi:CsbD family protein [Streptomyces sp. NPDC001380]|uniref:CsbD family protein n=1 Tax=Streptomyces sp. NPDC001380 TaxID=3364566 RepID=UPI0036852AE1